MSFLGNATRVLLTSVASLALGLATNVVLARWLAVEERGLYAVATAFVAMALLLANLGWADASIYRLRRVRSSPPAVAGAGIVASLVASVLAVSACVVLQPWVSAELLDGAPAIVLYLALLSFPFRMLGNVFMAMARGLGRFDLQNRYRLITDLAILIALVAVLVGTRGGLIQVLVAAAAMRALCTLVFVAWMLRLTGASFRIRVDDLRDTARFGVKAWLWGLAGETHERIDLFMIAWLLADPKLVAFYTIAGNVVGRLKLVPEALGSVLFPQLSGLAPRPAAEFASLVARQALALTLAAIVALALTADFFVPLLFGAAYQPSVEPLRILLPAMAAHGIFRVLARWFNAMDRQGANIATQLFSLPLNVILNWLWIPRFGIAGAAAASLVSYSAEAVLIVLLFSRASGVGAGSVLLAKRSDVELLRRRLRGSGAARG